MNSLTINTTYGKVALDINEPSKCSLSNEEVRRWYLIQDRKIPDLLMNGLTNEEKARQACEIRNELRTVARDLMEDQEARKVLDASFPNMTFEDRITDKMRRKHLTREEAILDILKTATKTNASVNKRYGLE